MSLREEITQALLDSIDDPAELGKIYRRYGRSKGPFYLALAAATAALDSDFKTLVQNRHAVKGELDRLQIEARTLEERRDTLDQTAQELERDIGQKEARLSDVQGLIEAADRLESQGFGKESIDRLFDLLGEVAASQGEPADNGVEMFFEVVHRWGGLVSIELENQRAQVRADKAKAQGERWEADAKRQEAKTKARAASIEIVEQLMDAGVKANDLPTWQTILNKAGVSPDKLAASLEQLGNA